MSADAPERGSDRRSATLFDESQLPIPATPREPTEAPNAWAARVMAAQRDQIELRACDLDSLLGADHAARTVWAFVHSLDLGALHASIKAVERGPSGNRPRDSGGAVAAGDHRWRGFGTRDRSAVRARRRVSLDLRRRGG